MTTIGSLMKTELVAISPNEVVSIAAQRMVQTGVGALLVVHDGKLLGLCSERDVVERVVAAGKKAATTTVEEIMTEVLQTVTPDTRLRRCAEILRAGRFRHLPVVVDGRAVGIVSARDFFAHVAERLEQVVDQEKYKKDLGDGVDPYDHAGGSYGH